MNVLRDRMTEGELLETVMQLAKFHGWLCTHFRPSMTEHGWRTALSGHKGFPDLVLCRDGVVLIVELKTMRGRVTKEQQRWADAIGEQYRLWRPDNLNEIREALK